MNKNILYLGLGTILGAASGSVATYFIVKEKFALANEEDMENYSNHCETRIEKLKEEIKDLKNKLGVVKETPDQAPILNDPEEEKINHNEGVKKYHHNDGLNSKYGENRVFDKQPMTSNYVEKKEKDSKLINDIDEEEFMNQENGYEKQTIDVFLGDDKYMCGVWGYQTDNEDDVDRKWGKPLEDLIGQSHTYDELLSYCKEDDGIGLVWVKNDEMKIDFELIIHDSREDDKE